MDIDKKKLYNNGYIEYIDERGLTNKALRARHITTQISEINQKVSSVLEQLHVKFFRNPTTVVSSSEFENFSEILQESFNMWEKIKYPFVSQLLVRSAVFDQMYDFGLPNKVIELDDPSATAKQIAKILPELNNPEQLLLHPQLSPAQMRKVLTAFRVKTSSGGIFADIITGGIEHIKESKDAEVIYFATADALKGTIQLQYVSGNKQRADENMYRNLMLAMQLLSPYIEGIIIPQEHRGRSAIIEFRVVSRDDTIYMDFNDFEIV